MEDKRMGKQFFLFSIFDPLSSILHPLSSIFHLCVSVSLWLIHLISSGNRIYDQVCRSETYFYERSTTILLLDFSPGPPGLRGGRRHFGKALHKVDAGRSRRSPESISVGQARDLHTCGRGDRQWRSRRKGNLQHLLCALTLGTTDPAGLRPSQAD